MSYEPFQEQPGGFEPPAGYPPPPTPPPTQPPPPPPVARQLVRDPYTKLGGVASGLAHHYGLDVSLVRLLFVAFTLFTGFGVPIYLVAWIIIPRAQYWPPVGTRKPARSLTAREIGIGLLLVGALVALFFNGGAFSEIMVPLALIAGGIWMLAQAPTEESAPASTGIPRPVGVAGAPPPFDPGPVDTGPADGMPPGSPVPPKRRRWWPVLVGVALLLFAIPVAAVIALLASDVDFNSDFEARYQPADVSSIPPSISHDQGEIIVDLTELDSSMFDGEPVRLEIDHGLGDVRVLVPTDLVVSVDAEAGVGDVDVFESSDDGIAPRESVTAENPDIEIDINLGAGQILVERE